MTDTRTCERCSHLRTEHKLERQFFGPFGKVGEERGPCDCCDCDWFRPEPDDAPWFDALTRPAFEGLMEESR